MIHRGEDACDEPTSSARMERHFTGSYRRMVLEGVGHFPTREAPEIVSEAIIEHLATSPENS
jgi:pimeloyl-ACP methyl ester carboxylesterase